MDEARALAHEHRFLHWELAFPNVWDNWLSPDPAGGFDAVIGNPPYVRQEQIRSLKPALKKAYRAYDGMADLYVYFYELGLRLLRPGGRLSYVVTNKWLRAGYAEELRGLLSSEGWLEAVADFGHAKKFFPGADVFPCVIVVRRPDGPDPPEEPKSARFRATWCGSIASPRMSATKLFRCRARRSRVRLAARSARGRGAHGQDPPRRRAAEGIRGCLAAIRHQDGPQRGFCDSNRNS